MIYNTIYNLEAEKNIYKKFKQYHSLYFIKIFFSNFFMYLMIEFFEKILFYVKESPSISVVA